MPTEMQQATAFQYVTLVDRVGTGGCELIYDGNRIVFKPGEIEKVVPEFVATWLFQGNITQQHVWTADGQFVCRFAVKGDPSLLAALGPEAGDLSPIQIDTGRIEGWDTSGVDPAGRRAIPINVPSAAFRERQGNVGSGAYGERKE